MGYNKWSGGESTQKPYDKKRFDSEFDRIFGKKSQGNKSEKQTDDKKWTDVKEEK